MNASDVLTFIDDHWKKLKTFNTVNFIAKNLIVWLYKTLSFLEPLIIIIMQNKLKL